MRPMPPDEDRSGDSCGHDIANRHGAPRREIKVSDHQAFPSIVLERNRTGSLAITRNPMDAGTVHRTMRRNRGAQIGSLNHHRFASKLELIL